MTKLTFLIFIFLSFIFSCNKNNIEEKSKPVARVHDKYLYEKDLQGLFDNSISKEDSTRIIKAYIDKWIRKQLLLDKAELNLSDEQKDVEMELQDYRSSLLIYKYEQLWISQNLDTIVKDEEIEEYYSLYGSNFILEEEVVKAIYIKVPNVAPNIDQAKKWYKSDNADDLLRLESFCYDFAKKYENHSEEWISLNVLMKDIPFDISNREYFLKWRKCIETSDSIYTYLLNIKDYRLKNDISPLSFVRENIKQIIINKRKLQLISQLENDIYNDALNYGNFKIYN